MLTMSWVRNHERLKKMIILLMNYLLNNTLHLYNILDMEIK